MEGVLLAKLPGRQKLAYSIGHVFNDLCASMWFTYLLLYFHFVLEFNNKLSGIILLVGQVADGLATPFVGIEADRTDNFFLCRYGRRKTWHLIGTACVLFSFPFLFIHCLGCAHSSQWAQLIYYSAFVVIFQFGWASVQISHLSLIPDLTKDPHERTELNAFRYAFTVVSNIFVFGVTWLILGISTDGSDPSQHEHIGPEDLVKFRQLVIIVIGVGAVHSLLFHIGVKEEQIPNFAIQSGVSIPSLLAEDLSSFNHMTWTSWFFEVQFYLMGLLYMFTRLFVNLTQVYMPLYLQDTLRLKEESIAIIPLVMYVSGFLSSFFMKALNKHAGRKITYALGALLGLGGCVWINFGEGQSYTQWQLYCVASLIGVGSSTMLITSLSLTADLIGNNVESGAFVFGAMSFTDKLANGLVIMLIQYLNPCQTHCQLCTQYYQAILSYVCGGAAVISFLVLLTLVPQKMGRRSSDRNLLINANEEEPVMETDNG